MLSVLLSITRILSQLLSLVTVRPRQAKLDGWRHGGCQTRLPATTRNQNRLPATRGPRFCPLPVASTSVWLSGCRRGVSLAGGLSPARQSGRRAVANTSVCRAGCHQSFIVERAGIDNSVKLALRFLHRLPAHMHPARTCMTSSASFVQVWCQLCASSFRIVAKPLVSPCKS